MPRILIAYSTVDGQTRKISERLQRELQAAGHGVTLANIADATQPDPTSFDIVVVGASIRYGKYRPELFAYVARHQAALEARPNAFFTVNAVARKTGRDVPERNPYVKNFYRDCPWRPKLVGVFAGRIDYPKLGFRDRNIIRFIMWITRGPTDPRGCFEFTDWDKVDAFAQRVAAVGS
jgi:menaquinone-dependent protoporphyrinogen oxidase